MKVGSVRSETVARAGRLDCSFHLSAGNAVAARIHKAASHGAMVVPLGGEDGLAAIWQPARFKRVYAAAGEPCVPYIRPYDVFNYLPAPADWLSATRNKGLSTYRLSEGMILQTCSGRNLGPAVLVDGYLARFVVGDDMMRIEIGDERLRHYALAFLNSQAGRSLIRQGKTGSVIDHLSDKHLAEVEVPLFDDELTDMIAATVRKAVALRAQARIALDAQTGSYERALKPIAHIDPRCKGWTVRSSAVRGRLDAAFYDPLVASVRRRLARMGGVTVGEVANVVKPGGRYKTRYVHRDQGRPMLSGAQVLQTSPVNLQFIAPSVFKDIAEYELRSSWIAYPADGRAEEELGTPVLITTDRDGWLGSGHIGRVIPHPTTDVGWLFLALRTNHAQMQLKARASGSVVDSTFADDMREVI